MPSLGVNFIRSILVQEKNIVNIVLVLSGGFQLPLGILEHSPKGEEDTSDFIRALLEVLPKPKEPVGRQIPHSGPM